MTRNLIAYGILIATFPALDIAWFAGLAHGFYQAEIGRLLNPALQLAPAAAFYALYAAGVLTFVLSPRARLGWRATALAAAFFGLVAYGTFDLTCLALMRGFTLAAGVVDIAWGVFATTAAASLARLALVRS